MPCLSILVLGEDSGKDAPKMLRKLVGTMLRLVEPQVQTQRVRFSPVDPEAQAALRSNTWKSTKQRDRVHKVRLFRTVARKLAEQDGFVFWHVDGDTAWSQRVKSENYKKFESLARQGVRGALQSPVRGPVPNEVQVIRQIKRLICIMPFYSIEAWLFQNTDVVRRLCRKYYQDRGLEQVLEWENQRSLLDEIIKIKKQSGLPFADKHNLELSIGFPGEVVEDVGTSFQAVVNELRNCKELVAALELTTK
ncbi:MAG: hypothetical protein ACPG77_05920 [Nannocystaceae bacterium]